MVPLQAGSTNAPACAPTTTLSSGSGAFSAGGASSESYGESVDCTWVITAASVTDIIQLTFSEFRVWSGDLIRIYAGTDTSGE